MKVIELIHTILLLIIIDRLYISRARYKIGIYTNFDNNGYWAIWLYCQNEPNQPYTRVGGRVLIYFTRYIIPHLKK